MSSEFGFCSGFRFLWMGSLAHGCFMALHKWSREVEQFEDATNSWSELENMVIINNNSGYLQFCMDSTRHPLSLSALKLPKNSNEESGLVISGLEGDD
ncbi:hypothetical protein FRX31_019768 [Thalictrum thalictroides]|uniref:Uncharacterized protein n=1 Tax=Thalictrum thalictroides TaxID=46969 RepID=A0A7J6W272_THATH|nr:hypothetical protein FRX31_019768 [Thalictrum thalictroides]